MGRGKKYEQAVDSFDRDAVYSWENAIEMLKGFPKKKYDETVHITLSLIHI